MINKQPVKNIKHIKQLALLTTILWKYLEKIEELRYV